jgi:hypothetical protein
MRKILLATTAMAGLLFAPVVWAQDHGGAPGAAVPGAAAPGGAAEQGAKEPSGGRMMKQEPGAQKGEMRGEQPGKAGGAQTGQTREQPGKATNQREERGQAGTQGQKQPNEGQRQGAEQTTGQQGGKAAAANLSSEQKTQVNTNLRNVNVREATDINITNVRIGVTVPHTVVNYWAPVPSDIVTIVPAWRSYRVVRIHGELVIIDPATFDIVYVLI